jgi:hypothetical protein
MTIDIDRDPIEPAADLVAEDEDTGQWLLGRHD